LHNSGLVEDNQIHVNDNHQVVPALSAAGAEVALEVAAVSVAAEGVPLLFGAVGLAPPSSAGATEVAAVGVALDDDFVVASSGEPTLVVVGDSAGIAVGAVSAADAVPGAPALTGAVGVCMGVVPADDPAAVEAGALPLAVDAGGAAGLTLDDDPVAPVAGALPLVVVVDAAGTRAGSVSGGKVGRAVQNHPMICMPGQLKVPELAS
jgi:hypothetical protein